METLPVPTAAQAGTALAYLDSQAGIVATILAVFCAVFLAAIVLGVRYFGAQLRDAWARVTQISEARTADARAGDEALNKNTLALTIVAERLNNRSS